MVINDDRELLPDILKGFAIILVVLGHCIQEGSGVEYTRDALYFSDKLYQFIYSFHMPLFMMISGYLAWGSFKRADDVISRRILIRRRACALLIPIFAWTGIDYIRILITNYINGAPQPDAIIFVYFYNAINNFWFLWAVWWCLIIVYVIHYFMRDSVIVYLIGFMMLFIIPDGLGLGAYKYMMPYFIVAFYFHRFVESKGIKCIEKWKYHILAILSVCFVGMFMLYNEESFIYLTGYKLIGKDVLHQLYLDIYRLLIGFVGSMVFIILWECITDITGYKFKLLRILGADSMGIYILSGYILVFIVQRFDFIKGQSYVLNIIETIVVLVFSTVITEIFGKNKYLKKLVGR